jgi:hypothetical protein
MLSERFITDFQTKILFIFFLPTEAVYLAHRNLMDVDSNYRHRDMIEKFFSYILLLLNIITFCKRVNYTRSQLHAQTGVATGNGICCK